MKTNDPKSNEVADPHTPRRLTLAENAILTAKVLAVSGVILALLWGLNEWTTAA